MAGELVLPGVFGEYRYSAWSDAGDSPRPCSLRDVTLTSVFNATAPLMYSSTDYARYPPWAKFDDLERHLGGIKIAQVTADRGERPFLQSQDLNSYLTFLQEQVVRRGLEDKPAAETSSWLAE